MFNRLSQMKVCASSFLLVTIIMWQAGLGCAFCCLTKFESNGLEKVFASQGNDSSENARQEFDCCRKAKTKSTRSEQPVSPSGDKSSPPQLSQVTDVSACSLLPHNLASAKISSPYADNLSVKAELIPLPFTAVSQSLEAKFVPAILPLNRGGTFLRHCILLI